jgi:hypothetical protein
VTWLWRLIPHAHVTDYSDWAAVLWQTGPKAGTTGYTWTHHCRRCNRWFTEPA